MMLLLVEVPDGLFWEVKQYIDEAYPLCLVCQERFKRDGNAIHCRGEDRDDS